MSSSGPSTDTRKSRRASAGSRRTSARRTCTIPRSGIPGPRCRRLNNQHRVAITVEPILFFYGRQVGLAQQVAPGEGADEEKESRSRQMEIRDQGIDQAKLVGRINEN